MARLITKLQTRRRGIVAVMVAVLLTVLVGVAALALDGGLLQDNRRRVQGAADASALAAATQLFKNFTSISSTKADPGGNGVSAARAVAASNGYNNDGTTSVVTVNIPPLSGPFAGLTGSGNPTNPQPAYVEVIITYYQPRYFSGIWGSSSMPVVGRAVARAIWGGSNDGVITLDPTASGALNATGGSSLNVTGSAAVIVDSNSSSAAITTGGGSVIAPQFDITGGVSGTFTGTVNTGVLPTPDPLAYLPAPAMPAAGTITKKHIPSGGNTYTLTPGTYTSLPNFNSGDTVILEQASANLAGGIYYLYGCGFTAMAGVNISMDAGTSGGVMLYNEPTNSSSSQGITINGNSSSSINLSALTSGPYAGILFWQDRSATQGLNVAGSANFNLIGTFYAASANLTVSGGGTAVIGSQYISDTLTLSGGGAVNINYSPQGSGRPRIVGLVE
jgi:hypothetical protein